MNVDFIEEEPCRVSYTIVPVGTKSETFHMDAYIACLDTSVVTCHFGRNKLHLSVAVLCKFVASKGLPGQVFEASAVLHIGSGAVFYAFRQQNPCPELVEEVGGNGGDVAVTAEVDHDVGVFSAPSYPAFHISGAAVESVGKGRFCNGLVAGIGCSAG